MHRIVTALAAAMLVAAAAAGASSFGNSAQSRAQVDAKVVQQIAAHGETTFWVVMRDEANLRPARSMRPTPRGEYVYRALTQTAQRSQAPLKRLLTAQNVDFKSFWVLNAIRVHAGISVLNEVAARPEVEQIIPDAVFRIPKTTPGHRKSAPDTVEWGVQNINAPQVWSTYNDRGDGIVVGNIDTGVMYSHAALVTKYRGNSGGGNFNHNYNWFDPSNICSGDDPCDNNGHGTHTMGTMVGDDGDPGANQIGVAPHAKWIAAKGCETNSCSTTALLASGQFMLAPTDLTGLNPQPSLRPDIVNNSWVNSNGGDPFYQATVQAWVASGIFPTFSNGNTGPGCSTVGSPASYPESYGVGAYDIDNAIASFSSRGPAPAGFGGAIKPNISAPGVNVRSSFNNGSYGLLNGTSMAAPHVSGAVALLWSGAPSLRRNISGTEALLNQTAIDTAGGCGGTTENNNTFGEGRLNVLAAMQAAPPPPPPPPPPGGGVRVSTANDARSDGLPRAFATSTSKNGQPPRVCSIRVGTCTPPPKSRQSEYVATICMSPMMFSPSHVSTRSTRLSALT
jgi:subtilisin family serine protease